MKSLCESLKNSFENGEFDDLIKEQKIQDQNEQRYVDFINKLSPKTRRETFIKINFGLPVKNI